MTTQQHYRSVAVILHWVIAIMILSQVAGGIYMHKLPNDVAYKFDLYQLHKSFGLTILLLSLVRLGWRLTHKPPALPGEMPGWQKVAARATHVLFYVLMIGAPIVGWAMVSVSPKDIPTEFFGVLHIPHLPLAAGVTDREAAELLLQEVHEYMGFTILGLFVLHVGAAIKHHVVNKDDVLQSMLPAKPLQWIGIAVIFASLGAGVFLYGTSKSDQSTPAAINAEPQVAATGNWRVEMDESRLGFIGTQNERRFEGRFSEFTAIIQFDENDLITSSIEITVPTGSATSGDELRDSTLPSGEWFDVKAYPEATFTSRDIRKTDAGYEAHGVLAIKNFSRQLVLPFALNIVDDVATAKGSVDVMRIDYGLGTAQSWETQEGVGLSVSIEFALVAKRQE